MINEYIRKQDAIAAAYKGFCHPGVRCPETPCKEQTKYLRGLPSVDVVQVVRCRKCKYFWTYRCMDSMPIETCELAQTFYNPDLDFCSLAKRREE